MGKMKELLLAISREFPAAIYKLRYFDHDGVWTVPAQLTERRIDHFHDDHSLDKVEINIPGCTITISTNDGIDHH